MFSPFRLPLFILLALIMPDSASAENLIANSSFELGDAGTLCVRLQDPTVNKGLVYETPSIDHSTAVHGKASLMVSNHFGDAVKLHFREIELEPDTEYTFSVWLKTDSDSFKVRLNALSISQPGNVSNAPQDWYSRGTTVQAGKEWKRFSCTFQSGPAPHKFYDLFLDFKDAGGLWIDAVQLSKGALSTYEPKSTMEMALSTDRDLYSLSQFPFSAQIEIRAVNYSKSSGSLAVKLVAKDDYTGAETQFPNFSLDIPPGSDSSHSVTWNLSRFGSFILDASTEGSSACDVVPGYVTAVGRYEAKPLDLDRSFCVSVNDSAGGLIINPKDGRVFNSSGSSVENLYSRLGVMGCRLLRLNSASRSPFFWSFLEPSKGSYDFGFCDRFVDLCTKNNIALLPNIGAFQMAVSRNHFSSIPNWLVPLCKEDKEGYVSWLKWQVMLPPQELWRGHIDTLTSHYKGRITHYEIMNEPLFWLTPENYAAFLKTAYPVIKNSGAKTVGICASTDFGANATPWITKVCELGALDYCDAVSFHPYDARQISSKRPADTEIEALHDIMASYGKPSMPVWNTEVYYLNNAPHNTLDALDSKAHDVATRFLTDLGEGVAQSSCIPGDRVFRKWTLPHLISADFAMDMKASPIFVAYNALARHFEGAKPLAKFRWTSECICYAFEREDGLSAAFWYYGNSQSPKLRLDPSHIEVELYDLFGNRLPLDSHPLNLENDPFYLKLDGKVTEEKKVAFLALLKAAQIEAKTDNSQAPANQPR